MSDRQPWYSVQPWAVSYSRNILLFQTMYMIPMRRAIA